MLVFDGGALSKKKAKEAACCRAIQQVSLWSPAWHQSNIINHVPQILHGDKKDTAKNPKTPLSMLYEYCYPKHVLTFSQTVNGANVNGDNSSVTVAVMIDGVKVGESSGRDEKDAKHAASSKVLRDTFNVSVKDFDRERDNTNAWVGDRVLYMIVGLMGEERGWTAEKMQMYSEKMFSNEGLKKHAIGPQ